MLFLLRTCPEGKEGHPHSRSKHGVSKDVPEKNTIPALLQAEVERSDRANAFSKALRVAEFHLR